MLKDKERQIHIAYAMSVLCQFTYDLHSPLHLTPSHPILRLLLGFYFMKSSPQEKGSYFQKWLFMICRLLTTFLVQYFLQMEQRLREVRNKLLWEDRVHKLNVGLTCPIICASIEQLADDITKVLPVRCFFLFYASWASQILHKNLGILSKMFKCIC